MSDGRIDPVPASSHPLPLRARPVFIVWLFVGIVVCLLGLTVYSSQLLAAGRAFAAADSAWSKTRGDAVQSLSRYANSRAEDDLRRYERAMAVLDGERAARRELEKAVPDAGAAAAGLRAAGVDEHDIGGLVALQRQTRALEPMRYVGTLRTRIDFFVDELKGVAERLRHGGPAGSAADQIRAIDLAIEPLENESAATIADVLRTAQSLLTSGILIIAGILMIAGITLSRRFIAQNERLRRSLAESETQLRHLVEAAPLPLLIVRANDQRLLYVNERALEQFGLDVDAALSSTLAQFHVDPEARAALSAQLARHESLRDLELHFRDAKGRDFWLLLSAEPVRYAGAPCFMVALSDIDERKRLQDDMRRKAMHDPLTGLPNRAMFMESLERAVHKSRRRSTRFSVLFIDLDRFKEVNDTMGHHAGDTLLQVVAERLAAAVRQSDMVARLAGDEFVVLIEEHGGPEEVMIVAQKVLSMLQRPVPIDWREAAVSGSIGIASYPEDGTDVSTLVKNADAAMYQAKERGRNNFQFYSPELNALSHHRFEQEKRVRAALERDEFFLEYQPELDLATGKPVAAEALLRWRDPTAGVVMPAAFMALAEETGTMAAIGMWVLDRGLRDLRAWRDQGLHIKLAVNVSARQLQQHDLVEEVARLLALHGVEAASLRLEITESTLMQDSDAANRTVRSLRGLGVELAIDNFGTGYSSLGLVRGLPIQVVKIDKSLVSYCPSKRECAAIVQAAAAMSRVLGIRVVAEGVETEEQREVMKALGCDGLQGYLLARPMDAAGIAAMTRAAAAQTLFA